MSLKTKHVVAPSKQAVRLGIMVVVAASAMMPCRRQLGMSPRSSTWVSTWAASPQPTWGGDFPLPTLLPFNLWNQTVRQKVRVSLGGDSLRIVMSNEYGTPPLVIESVHVALPGDERLGDRARHRHAW